MSIAGPEIFMLIDAYISSIPPTTLRSGVNRIWVKGGALRENYTFVPVVGDLEIRTVR